MRPWRLNRRKLEVAFGGLERVLLGGRELGLRRRLLGRLLGASSVVVSSAGASVVSSAAGVGSADSSGVSAQAPRLATSRTPPAMIAAILFSCSRAFPFVYVLGASSDRGSRRRRRPPGPSRSRSSPHVLTSACRTSDLRAAGLPNR